MRGQAGSMMVGIPTRNPCDTCSQQLQCGVALLSGAAAGDGLQGLSVEQPWPGSGPDSLPLQQPGQAVVHCCLAGVAAEEKTPEFFSHNPPPTQGGCRDRNPTSSPHPSSMLC